MSHPPVKIELESDKENEMTIEETITNLSRRAADLHREGRITTRDLRDIVSELEGNGSAIRGVEEFLSTR